MSSHDAFISANSNGKIQRAHDGWAQCPHRWTVHISYDCQVFYWNNCCIMATVNGWWTALIAYFFCWPSFCITPTTNITQLICPPLLGKSDIYNESHEMHWNAFILTHICTKLSYFNKMTCKFNHHVVIWAINKLPPFYNDNLFQAFWGIFAHSKRQLLCTELAEQ